MFHTPHGPDFSGPRHDILAYAAQATVGEGWPCTGILGMSIGSVGVPRRGHARRVLNGVVVCGVVDHVVQVPG